MTAVRQQENKPALAQQELFPLKASQSFRDDIEMMALPFFSISKKPRFAPIEHRYTPERDVERYVRVTGGEKGIATIWDNDLLIYARTLIAGKLNRGEPASNKIVFSVHDFLIATGRDTGLKAYQAFKESVVRLQTTTVFTNIAAGDYVEDSGFGWLQSFRMRKVKRGTREVLSACEITLCDWIYQAALAQRFLAVERSYFDLTSALERKLWLIMRRHLGRQPMWFVSLERLQERCASQQDSRKFRHEIKKIVERNPFPEFKLSMTSDARPLMRNMQSESKPGRALYLVVHQRRTLAS